MAEGKRTSATADQLHQDPEHPEFGHWVTKMLAEPNGLSRVLTALSHALYPFHQLPAVGECIGQMKSGRGVRRVVLLDALNELKHRQDLGQVGAVLKRLTSKVGVRKDAEQTARSSRGGVGRVHAYRAKWADWNAIGRELLREDPKLTRRELAKKIQKHLKTTNARDYELAFRTQSELRSPTPDSVRTYAQSLDDRALNQIYLRIRGLFATDRLRRGRRRV